MNDCILVEDELSQIGDDWVLKYLKVGEYAEESGGEE